MPERLALIGAKGMLAWALHRQAEQLWEVAALDLPEFDITDRGQVLRVLGALRPSVILNCAALTDVDGCESKEELANAVNGRGPGHLAEAARAGGATLVHVSTDYVFDGSRGRPYVEEDATGPTSAYGRSKLLGEHAILESGLERFYLVRTSWLFGLHGKNFVETIARLAAEREELRIVGDQVGSPTYTADLGRAILTLLGSPAPFGVYHFSNEGVCSWHEFAGEIVAELRQRGQRLKVSRILPIRTEEYPLPARRPAYSVLSKEKYKAATRAGVPHWRHALGRYMALRGDNP